MLDWSSGGANRVVISQVLDTEPGDKLIGFGVVGRTGGSSSTGFGKITIQQDGGTAQKDLFFAQPGS
jgi:hypothetical protein